MQCRAAWQKHGTIMLSIATDASLSQSAQVYDASLHAPGLAQLQDMYSCKIRTVARYVQLQDMCKPRHILAVQMHPGPALLASLEHSLQAHMHLGHILLEVLNLPWTDPLCKPGEQLAPGHRT
eukprot:1160729-Pelagomonas_calceolata.AAC.18